MLESSVFVEVDVSSPDMLNLLGVPVEMRVLLATRVDISLSDDRRILVEGSTSLLAVVGLVEGLSA